MKRSIGRALAVAVVLTASIGTGVLIRSWLFDAASPPSASARRQSCDQLVQSFDGYPLLNLGNEFEGFPLTSCHRTQTPTKFDQAGNVREPAMDFIVFIYGDCTPPRTGEGCSPPIEVFSDPPCGPSLETQEGTVKIRGADVNLKFDGSVRIETPGYQVSIFIVQPPDKLDRTQRRDMALRAVDFLRGANQLAARLSPSVALDGESVDAGTYCK